MPSRYAEILGPSVVGTSLKARYLAHTSHGDHLAVGVVCTGGVLRATQRKPGLHAHCAREPRRSPMPFAASQLEAPALLSRAYAASVPDPHPKCPLSSFPRYRLDGGGYRFAIPTIVQRISKDFLDRLVMRARSRSVVAQDR